MKKILLFAILQINIASFCNSQTNLITNGGFESSTWYSNWGSINANGDLWGGPGNNCSPYEGTKYCWCGDQYQNTGLNDVIEDIYQTVTIPYNTTSCVLYFRASINTLESGTTDYDYMNINIRSTSGTLLYSLGNINNSNGTYGIPGCEAWQSFYATIPSSYFGQTVRISLEFTTDNSNPTIFRLDEVSLMATLPGGCTYSLSNSYYTCPNANANNYNNIISVNTQSGCTWNANVTSGNSWLTTTSSGVGNGGISILVTQNTSTNSRQGTINIGGQTLTINQPGTINCTYSLSSNNYLCPNGEQNTYSNVLLVNTQSGCAWNANVTSGNTWLTTSSSGIGSGTISFIVLKNLTASPRYGIIDIAGQTLTIEQPGAVGIEEIDKPQFSIYPNPFTDKITIVFDNIKDLQINLSIFDIQGKLLLQQMLNQAKTAVDISAFSQGIYFLKLENSRGIAIKKIIKE